MPKFRKKPVVIDAQQFRLAVKPYPADVIAVSYTEDGAVVGAYPEAHRDGVTNIGFGIKTAEGWHLVTDGDWIITGVKGERYPCKNVIFLETYDPVEEMPDVP